MKDSIPVDTPLIRSAYFRHVTDFKETVAVQWTKAHVMNGSCIETEIATKDSGLPGRLSRNRSQSFLLVRNRRLLLL